MADMDIRPKYVPGCSAGWSRNAKDPHRYQAASCKESCKSSWECSSASVTSMQFEPSMAGATLLRRREKNHLPAEVTVREGAGGLLLLAAANETGLLSELETAMSSCSPTQAASLLTSSPRCRRQLVLTLLFLNLGGLRRTRDLRGYTGTA